MNPAKKGLGRGLSALFGELENSTETKINNVTTVQISDLQRNKYQPRLKFDQKKLEELSNSIKENGVIQPIAVRPNKYENGKYEIIAGERRWLASQMAGLNEIPVVIFDIGNEKSLAIVLLPLEDIKTRFHIDLNQLKSLFVLSLIVGSTQWNKSFFDHDKINPYRKKPSKNLKSIEASSVSTEVKLVLCASVEWCFAGLKYSKMGKNGLSSFWRIVEE